MNIHLKINTATFSNSNIDYNNQISIAITDLNLQKISNYSTIEKKYGLIYIILY